MASRSSSTLGSCFTDELCEGRRGILDLDNPLYFKEGCCIDGDFTALFSRQDEYLRNCQNNSDPFVISTEEEALCPWNLPRKTFKLGDIEPISVQVVHESDGTTVNLLKNAKAVDPFQSIFAAAQKFCPNEPPILLTPGVKVGAQSNGDWARGYVLGESRLYGDVTIRVRLVDYNETCHFFPDQLKRLPNTVAEMPIVGFCFKIPGEGFKRISADQQQNCGTC